MKVVIDIPDGYVGVIMSNQRMEGSAMDKLIRQAIINGTPYEERPKGEWIEKVERRGCFAGDRTVYSYTCPFCKVTEFKKYPFCHCGADMRGNTNEDSN